MFSQLSKKSLTSRLIAAPLGIALLTSAALQPVRSDAMLLGIILPPAAGVALASVVLGAATVTFIRDDQNQVQNLFAFCYYGGFVALDGSNRQKAVLNPITNEQAHKSGVTAIEQENYNHDLDLIQATFDDITAQVALLPAAEQKSKAHELWNKYRSAFAPESFSALEKITTAMAKQNQ